MVAGAGRVRAPRTSRPGAIGSASRGPAAPAQAPRSRGGGEAVCRPRVAEGTPARGRGLVQEGIGERMLRPRVGLVQLRWQPVRRGLQRTGPARLPWLLQQSGL